MNTNNNEYTSQNNNNISNRKQFNNNEKTNTFMNKEEEDIINSSFSVDFSDLKGVDLFKEEKEYFSRENKNNETILDQKISKNKESDINFPQISPFIQPQDINLLESSFHMSVLDKDKEKETEYLASRQISFYDKTEFDLIREKVKKNLHVISDFLINRNYSYNEINRSKKIGPLLPLTALIENTLDNPKYVNIMNAKYQRLKKYICNYRSVFGDGNCYYRAVMFRYIELIILKKKTENLKLIIIDMYKSFQSDEVQKRLFIGQQRINQELLIQIMIIILELLENDRIIEAHKAFYKALTCSKDFDISLILYFRYILYDYIKKNEKKLYLKDFPVLIGNLLPSIYENDGIFNFSSFYENYLLKMFVFAEKIIVYLTPFVLGINLDVVLFDDNEDEVLKHFKFVGKDELNINETIFVINKKGHYENVFSYEDNKNFNYIYKYYRNDINPVYIRMDPNLYNLYLKIKNSNDTTNQKCLNNNNNTQNNNLQKQKTQTNNGNNVLKNNFFTNKENNISPNLTEYNNNNVRTFMHNNANEHGKEKLINLNQNQNVNNPNPNFRINNQYSNNFNNSNNNGDFELKNKLYNTFTHNNYMLNKCYNCSSINYPQSKSLKNICKNCLYNEILNKSIFFYSKFLEIMKDRINKASINDLNLNYFDKIYIIINNHNFSLEEIIEEFLFNLNLNKNINTIKKDIFLLVKQKVCLYCHEEIRSDIKIKIPCGCYFCCQEHLSKFFNEIVQNKLNYTYTCICAYQYKPHEILELCKILNENKVYFNNSLFFNHLESIFGKNCFKCGGKKNQLISISLNDNFSNNLIHKLCEDCIQNMKKNEFDCMICQKKHILL